MSWFSDLFAGPWPTPVGSRPEGHELLGTVTVTVRTVSGLLYKRDFKGSTYWWWSGVAKAWVPDEFSATKHANDFVRYWRRGGYVDTWKGKERIVIPMAQVASITIGKEA